MRERVAAARLEAAQVPAEQALAGRAAVQVDPLEAAGRGPAGPEAVLVEEAAVKSVVQTRTRRKRCAGSFIGALVSPQYVPL